MEREALDAWWAARKRNGETVVLAAPTNDTVARLNHAAQQRRIDTGALDPSGRHVEATATASGPATRSPPDATTASSTPTTAS